MKRYVVKIDQFEWSDFYVVHARTAHEAIAKAREFERKKKGLGRVNWAENKVIEIDETTDVQQIE